MTWAVRGGIRRWMALKSQRKVAVVGSGPAGLLAALEMARAGYEVVIFEKKSGPGRKFLIAGSSGLNITYDCPPGEFVDHYVGPRERFERFLQEFSPAQWIAFIESLGISTFKGTSRRYFVEGMKASRLLRAWLEELERLGARLEYGRECVGFERTEAEGVQLRFADGSDFLADAVCFALGGGSYEPKETPLRWPTFFRDQGLAFREFSSSNVGYQVDWPAGLIEEAEGKPIKNVVLSSSRGKRSGDLVITRYGLEGTPVYFAGEVGTVHLDLKPDLSEARLRGKLAMSKENLSPMRRVKRFLNMSEGALALIFHATPKEQLQNLDALIGLLKHYPVVLREKQPLTEAISSSGGLEWSEVDEDLMLRKFPGVFVAGEMLDWDAPTGGFLIQACVSQGHCAGRAMATFLMR
jgi:uncharacterized flavoprotein (TIGR03862 family)